MKIIKLIHKIYHNFALCGLIGWCIEIIYTALCCIPRKDFTIKGNTSIWMFPIYGMASVIGFVYPILKKIPPLFRGGLYGICILSIEYLSGSFLKKHHLCPWDYSNAKYNINGLIRLDYFPLWAVVGLLYETILMCDFLNRKIL